MLGQKLNDVKNSTTLSQNYKFDKLALAIITHINSDLNIRLVCHL